MRDRASMAPHSTLYEYHARHPEYGTVESSKGEAIPTRARRDRRQRGEAHQSSCPRSLRCCVVGLRDKARSRGSGTIQYARSERSGGALLYTPVRIYAEVQLPSSGLRMRIMSMYGWGTTAWARRPRSVRRRRYRVSGEERVS